MTAHTVRALASVFVSALAACSSSHQATDDAGRADAATDAAIDAPIADAYVPACTAAYPGSAFRPDSRFSVELGGVIRSRRAETPNDLDDEPGFRDPNDGAPEDEAPPDPRPGPPGPDGGTDGGGAAPIACGGDPVDGFAWDGHRCRGVLTTYCAATGACSGLYADETSCRAAHSFCDAELCRTTEGVWSEVPVRCSALSCGTFMGSDCDGPLAPQCVCPPGETFGEAGCAPDSDCEATRLADGCYASGGSWVSGHCGDYACGVPSALDCATSGCDCGPRMNFDRESASCIPDAECDRDADTNDQPLCEWSGGAWDVSTCGAYTCGVPSDAECLSGGCDCGPYGIFDMNVGCVIAPYCRTNACF